MLIYRTEIIDEVAQQKRKERRKHPSESARLADFNAHAIVDKEINYTIVGGRFAPTGKIDLTTEDVILSVGGADGLRLSLPAGSFSEAELGGYVASDSQSLTQTAILLQPLSCGDWTYSAGIEDFAPESAPVTVSLTIGGQAGGAIVEPYVF